MLSLDNRTDKGRTKSSREREYACLSERQMERYYDDDDHDDDGDED